MEKRAKFYWVKAIPGNCDFTASYGAPGLVPGLVRDEIGRAIKFPTESLAEHAAAQRLLEVINGLPALARSTGKKPEKYRKPTGPEFAELLAKANITPTAFAYICGQNLQRIQEWVAGIDEKGTVAAAPHWARVLLETFAKFPESFDFAMKVTDDHTTKN